MPSHPFLPGFSNFTLSLFCQSRLLDRRPRLSTQTGSKSTSSKKIPETDAIFEQLAIVNQSALDNESILRLSLDAKARGEHLTFANIRVIQIPHLLASDSISSRQLK